MAIAVEWSMRDRIRWFVRRQWERIFPPPCNLVEHAKRELTAAGYDLTDKTDGPNKWMSESVLELVRTFGRQGHSGFSAHGCLAIFAKVAAFEPLVPLSGKDDEWMEVSTGMFQNRRCSHVFKDADGKAYDIDGRIFREPDGGCFTNRESRVYVTFPYTPTREYVDVPARG